VQMPKVLKRRPGRRLVASLTAAVALSGAGVALTAGSASALPPDPGRNCAQFHADYDFQISQASMFFGMYTTDVLEGNWDYADAAYEAYNTHWVVAQRLAAENPGC
jgi:hypothetical protein